MKLPASVKLLRSLVGTYPAGTRFKWQCVRPHPRPEMGTDGIAGLSGATTRLRQGPTLWTRAHAHCGPQLQGCNRAAAQASSSSGALRTPVNRHRSTGDDAGVADGLVRIRLGMSTRPKVGGVCTRTCAPVRVGASVCAGAWGYMSARGCAGSCVAVTCGLVTSCTKWRSI